MKLIIVESPTKAKTISQFVGGDFKIASSYGHIRDLPKSKLGIDTENNFEPHYIVPMKAKKTVNSLKKLSAKSEKTILATDSDREGEAIAWHLAQALNLPPSKSERIVFHEITKSAIQAALKNPKRIDMNLVNAQQGRRVLDRLVGYKLSPFLWKKIARGLSAGRVQSVAVRLIVERAEEIKNFKPREYWTIKALFLTEAGDVIEAFLHQIEGKTIDKFAFPSKEAAEAVLKTLRQTAFVISKINRKEVKKNPLPPFITSTLQQTAANRLYFTAKKTMTLAQQLYERGLITYMRTDSTNLSKEALAVAKDWLGKEFGSEYASQAPRTFAAKSRLAQEAHEAIRPTDISQTPSQSNIKENDAEKLYELIWSRYVASQMPQAVFDSTQIDIQGGEHIFRANGLILKFDGFLKIWKQDTEEKNLPKVSENEDVSVKDFLPEQHHTEPPPSYTEASLIKTLEEYGIGRPSTYAPIISVIQERGYVQKDNGKFYPTEIGMLVNKVLTENFPEIVDIGFTAKMEEEFDQIAEGKQDWQKIIGEFYAPFSANLSKKYEEVSRQNPMLPEAINIACDKCGKPMVAKYSRFGKFLACSGFPECRNIKRIAKELKKVGLPCLKCSQGEIVERRAARGRARGKIFWGCSRYPECDYTSQANPAQKTGVGNNELAAKTPQD